MSTVDVVIPCYNYGRFLKGCTQSVLSQPGVHVRVLILDDASSDDTSVVGQALAAADSRVTFRRHALHIGHLATYNPGLIEWSTADYTVLLSADDLLAPGSLARAVAVMDNNPKVGLVYGSTIHFQHEANLPMSPAPRYGVRLWSGATWIELRCRAGYNVITSPEAVVRGSVQRAVGGYRPELPHSGDLEMWLRIAAVSDVAYITGGPQAFYRVHGTSMMRTIFHGSYLDLRQRKAAFDSFFAGAPYNLPNAALLRQQAGRCLAREALWDACRAYDRDQVAQRHAEDLVAFAFSAYEQADSLGEFAALRRRQRFGPTLCRTTQIFSLLAIARKLQHSFVKRRWQRQGV